MNHKKQVNDALDPFDPQWPNPETREPFDDGTFDINGIPQLDEEDIFGDDN